MSVMVGFFLVSLEVDLDEVLALKLINKLGQLGIGLNFNLFSFFVVVIDDGLVHSRELFGDEVLELLELDGSFVELIFLVVSDDCFHFKDNREGVRKYLSNNNLIISDAIHIV